MSFSGLGLSYAIREIAAISLVLLLARYILVRSPQARVAAPSGSKSLFLLLVLAALVCSPVLSLYFYCDDYAHLVAGAAGFISVVTDSFRHGLILNRSLYRPVGFALLIAEVKVFQGWAPGYHLVSLVLHLLCATGVFLLAREIGLGDLGPGAASGLFALLPVNAEALAWTAVQYDLLAATAITLGVYFYLRGCTHSGRSDFIFSFFLFSVAMGSKEVAFIYPLLLFALHLFVIKRPRIVPLAAAFILAAAGFALRWRIIGGLGGYANRQGRSLTLDFSHSLAGIFARAPAIEIFGVNWLQPPSRMVLGELATIACLLLLIAVFSRPRYRGPLFFGASWTIIALLPVHSLLFFLPIGLTGTHILYLSTIGMSILLGAAIAGLNAPGNTPLRPAADLAQTSWPVSVCSFVRNLHFKGNNGNVCLALLLVVFSLGLFHNLQAWHEDSEAIRALQASMLISEPHPPKGALFVFDGVPDWLHGACFFAVGIDAFVQFSYHRGDLDATRGGLNDVSGYNRPEIVWHWDIQGHRLSKVLVRKASAGSHGAEPF